MDYGVNIPWYATNDSIEAEIAGRVDFNENKVGSLKEESLLYRIFSDVVKQFLSLQSSKRRRNVLELEDVNEQECI